MPKALRIYLEELKLAKSNVIAALLLVGVILIPTLFTSYNVLACWNAFGNTGNLTVAVANSDAGYQSDIMPIKINVGDTVVSALHANKKLNWVFVDEEEAISGARSGKYYAAVVIPENFSSTMLTFYQSNGDPAELVLYSNEKLNAIMPKITAQGGGILSSTVNSTFAETVDTVVLSLIDSLVAYLDSDDAAAVVSELATSTNALDNRADQAADLLELYGELVSSAQKITGSTSSVVVASNEAIDDAADVVIGASTSATTVSTSLQTAFDSLSTAMDNVIDGVSAIASGELNDAKEDASSAQESATELAAKIAARKSEMITAIDAYTSARDALVKSDAAQSVIDTMDVAIEKLKSLRDNLVNLEKAVEAGYEANLDELANSAQDAAQALKDLKNKYNEQLKAKLSALSDSAATLAVTAAVLETKSDEAAENLSSALAAAGTSLGEVKTEIDQLVAKTRSFATELHTLSDDLSKALASNDMDQVRQVLKPGVQTLAKALSAPVQVQRTAVYAAENFGSAMFPLYGSLSLFVGSILIMLLISARVSPRALQVFEEDDQPGPRQRHFGHFCFVGTVSLLQSTLLGVISLFIVGVQAQNALLFMLCLWVSGLVFVAIMYCLINMLGNIGKAIGVLLMVVQVTGSGGTYPLELLPSFVQNISNFLPAFHVVNCLRAAMFGIYQNDYWCSLGAIACFGIAILVVLFIGVKAFEKFTDWYGNRSKETKLLA